ncbi:MAG: T9SS type A sorting domain-containing protein [Bacteroidales bacterium]|nr:T9SS type A sorting domain-containing protein [Bacteroidales bacterium]
MDQPLTAGNLYELVYFQKACTAYDNSDSLLIGASAYEQEFGSQIFASLPASGHWEKKSCAFVASSSVNYITVSNSGNQTGWNFVDNFSINDLGPETINGEEDLLFLPNPVADLLTIRSMGANSNKLVKSITLMDASGKVLESHQGNATSINSISMGHLPKGVYTISAATHGGTTSVKLITKN